MSESALTAHRLQDAAAEDEGQAKQIPGTRARLNSIDLLRGTVMIVMALDHTREFFGASGLNVRDVTAPALFLTRWVTHFCAPTFILLAGVSAYLYGTRGRTKAEVSRFLLTRGLWLIFVEFAVVRVAFSFSLDLNVFVIQVIAALGAAMMVLGGFIYLPRWLIATIALVMIGGHNLLDGIHAEKLGADGGIWHVLHQPGLLQLGPDIKLYVLYPLIPWIGVIAAGYVLGPWFELERSERLRRLLVLGTVAGAGFVLLRTADVYGDPAPWTAQGHWLSTALSFLNCEKYPPSLLYLAMTLGPSLLLLAIFEGVRGRFAHLIITYGPCLSSITSHTFF